MGGSFRRVRERPAHEPGSVNGGREIGLPASRYGRPMFSLRSTFMRDPASSSTFMPLPAAVRPRPEHRRPLVSKVMQAAPSLPSILLIQHRSRRAFDLQRPVHRSSVLPASDPAFQLLLGSRSAGA